MTDHDATDHDATDHDPGADAVRTVPLPPATHDDWMSAAELEYLRLAPLLESLTDREWHLPTTWSAPPSRRRVCGRCGGNSGGAGRFVRESMG